MNPDQDPWNRLEEMPPREDCKPPAASTISCIIIGMLVVMGFAIYGLYNIACWLLNLVP